MTDSEWEEGSTALVAVNAPTEDPTNPRGIVPPLNLQSVSESATDETLPAPGAVIETIWQDMANAFRALLAAPELGSVFGDPKTIATVRDPFSFAGRGARAPAYVDQLEWIQKGTYAFPVWVQIHLLFSSPQVFMPSAENPNGTYLQSCKSLPLPTADPEMEFTAIFAGDTVLKNCFPTMEVQKVRLWRTQDLDNDAFATGTLSFWPMPEESAQLCTIEVHLHPM